MNSHVLCTVEPHASAWGEDAEGWTRVQCSLFFVRPQPTFALQLGQLLGLIMYYCIDYY